MRAHPRTEVYKYESRPPYRYTTTHNMTRSYIIRCEHCHNDNVQCDPDRKPHDSCRRCLKLGLKCVPHVRKKRRRRRRICHKKPLLKENQKSRFWTGFLVASLLYTLIGTAIFLYFYGFPECCLKLIEPFVHWFVKYADLTLTNALDTVCEYRPYWHINPV